MPRNLHKGKNGKSFSKFTKEQVLLDESEK